VRRRASEPKKSLLVIKRDQRSTDKYGQDKYLEDLAIGECAKKRFRYNIEQEPGDSKLMSLMNILLDRSGIQYFGVDVQPPARAHQVSEAKAECQRNGRDDLEVHERFYPDATDLACVTHAGDPGDDRQEDDRRNQHPYQLDEAVAQRLESFPEAGKQETDSYAGDKSKQQPEIEAME
jgi:hypothetical protein